MGPNPPMVIRAAEIDGELVDVSIRDGRIAAIDRRGSAPAGDATVVEAGGGALLPGLHDHHLHLLAMAAARTSLDVADIDLDEALRATHAARPVGEWLRVVGYDEVTAGPLDRDRLDALVPGRPVRVQHRSGAMWVLSSAALDRLPLDDAPAGVERSADGRPTGRLHRLDAWLAPRVGRRSPPDLAPVGRALAARGITGVTDATPSVDAADFDLLARAVERGDLPLAVVVTGGPALAATAPPAPLIGGPVKVVVADHELPSLDQLEGWFHDADGAGRNVMVHCVTDVALVLAIAAWDAVGARDGDRVEHGAVVRPELARRIAAHGLTVVTQPGFVHRSGDRYLTEVDAIDLPHLYPCGSLLDAGVEVAASSDAPFGPADPWLAMATAVDRRTRRGRILGAGERIGPRRALDLYLGAPAHPGGPARTVHVGAPADLCVLDRPLATALGDLAAVQVVVTIRDGAVATLPR